MRDFDAVILACGAKQPRGLTAVITQTGDRQEAGPESGQQEKGKDECGKTKAQSIDHVGKGFHRPCTRCQLCSRLSDRLYKGSSVRKAGSAC